MARSIKERRLNRRKFYGVETKRTKTAADDTIFDSVYETITCYDCEFCGAVVKKSNAKMHDRIHVWPGEDA